MIDVQVILICSQCRDCMEFI